jgi:hypothetical protein
LDARVRLNDRFAPRLREVINRCPDVRHLAKAFMIDDPDRTGTERHVEAVYEIGSMIADNRRQRADAAAAGESGYQCRIARIADHPARRIDDLLPWNYRPA